MADISQAHLPDNNTYDIRDRVTHIELTQAQYDALVQAGQVDPDKVYFITDVPSMSGSSKDLSYDGTTKSVYTKIGEMNTTINSKADISSLATVATSGNYNDLFNKPTIPTAQVQSDWSQSDNTKVDYIKNKPTILTNAEQLPITSGSATNTKDYIDGRTPIYTGGHATDLSTTGLTPGTYLYKYDSTTNGIPQAGGEGDCYITINSSQAWGSELATSDRGLFWRNKVNQVWSDWLDISGKLTVHSGSSTGTVGVNGTYQIPADVLGHSLIIVSARRQGLGNSSIFEKTDLLARDNGFMLAASPTSYCIIKCSTTGLLTVTKLTGMSDVFINVLGIF